MQPCIAGSRRNAQSMFILLGTRGGESQFPKEPNNGIWGGGERQHERGAPVKEIGSARAEGSSQRRKKHGEKDRKVTGVCRNRQTGRADGGKRERERDGARTPRWKDKGTFTAQLKAFRI